MEGELYMIDKVIDPDAEMTKEYAEKFNKKDIIEQLKLDKVTINMNNQKFTISDKDSILKEIIYFDTVYPREKELQSTIDSNRDKARTKLEAMKVRVINATSVADSGNSEYPQFYCFSLINEPLYQNTLEDVYQSTLKESYKFTQMVGLLREKDKQNSESTTTNDFSNVHDH